MVMVIITYINGWTGEELPIFSGPGSSGVFQLGYTDDLLNLPKALDPVQDDGLREIFPGIGKIDEAVETVELNYDGFGPKNKEQIIIVTGLGMYRSKFYISPQGHGEVIGLKPQPQPEPHKYELYTGKVRVEGEYRRVKGFTSVNGREDYTLIPGIIGWERRDEYRSRKSAERL